MTLDEIKKAVEAGQTVCWRNPGYVVIKGKAGFFVKYTWNDHCSGLTWADGVTMEYKPEDFFIAK